MRESIKQELKALWLLAKFAINLFIGLIAFFALIFVFDVWTSR